jgi:hypothetical protein
MRWLYFVVLFCAGPWMGCGFLGIYRHQKAEWAPPEEAERVTFPNSFEKGTHLSGPMMKAVKVAMDEFLPPGSKVKADNERLGECLSRWETYDTSVLQVDEEVFFVRFFPVISRCGIDAIVLDAGAVYAVDARGRILAME